MTSEPTRTWASAEAAERWRLSAAQRQRTVREITDLMLNAVGLEPGLRVLDLAAGTGDTSILVARRVGPTGHVLAVDISAAMLHEAEDAARAEGLSNIETLVSDLVLLDLPPRSFGAAISRFGLMFLTDAIEGMRRIRSALEPGSRLAAAVWSTLERNPNMSIPLAVSEQFGHIPPEGSPLRRVSSLGGPGVFARALETAGFVDIDVKPVPITRDFDSIDDAIGAIEQTSSVLGELLGKVDESQQGQVKAAVRQRLSEFVRQPGGRCVVPGEALLGVASAPATPR